jgi:alkanesulfonate monooxygenase SsuD/methylene tetrahydromethanopterin reductase-like flavin-dependent oxidoreductase (luciferase family)
MRQLWSTGTATLDGRYYQVDGAISRPLPLQEGGVPLWIAGGGERKTLRTAAEYAQYTNFANTPEEFTRKSEVLAGHCRDVGTDFDAIVRSANLNVIVGETAAEAQERLHRILARFRPFLDTTELGDLERQLGNEPLVGTPEQIVEKLNEMHRLGMTYAITYFPEAAYGRSGIDLFTGTVMPAVDD